MMHEKKYRFSSKIVAIVLVAVVGNILALKFVEDKNMLFLVSTFIIFASAVIIIFFVDGNAKFVLKNFASKMEEDLEAGGRRKK